MFAKTGCPIDLLSQHYITAVEVAAGCGPKSQDELERVKKDEIANNMMPLAVIEGHH